MELRKIYVTRLEGIDTRVTVVRDGGGQVWVETADGARIEDALVLDEGRTVSIRRGGRMYLIDITPPQSEYKAAMVNGNGGRGEVLGELAAAAAEQEGFHGTGTPELRADMPGLVLEIRVDVGDSVAVGQPLVILEAMKMQNELSSPGTGEVLEILVEPGQSVDSGQPLLRLQTDPE